MTRFSWLALAALGCGSALPPPDYGADAPDATGIECSYPMYARAAVELAEARPEDAPDPALDPDLRLLDALHSSSTRLARLRVLDRVRVACRVRVPADRWSAAIVRRVDAAEARIEAVLHARQARVDPSDLDSLDGPLLDPLTRHGAVHALAVVDDAVRIAMEQRRQVLGAAVDDACTVERVAELEAWRDVARTTSDATLRSEAEEIASAIGRAPAEVEAAFGRARGLAAQRGDFIARRTRGLELVARCDGQVPVELLHER